MTQYHFQCSSEISRLTTVHFNMLFCNNCSSGLCQYNYKLLFVSVANSIFTHRVLCVHVTPVSYLNSLGRFLV
jgi:hypothetical protein